MTIQCGIQAHYLHGNNNSNNNIIIIINIPLRETRYSYNSQIEFINSTSYTVSNQAHVTDFSRTTQL